MHCCHRNRYIDELFCVTSYCNKCMKYKILLFILIFNLIYFSDTKETSAVFCNETPHGIKIDIPGYEDRPTYFEYDSPTAPLIVMLHGMNGCVADLQHQSQLLPNGTNILWVSGQIVNGNQRIWVVSRFKNGYYQTFDYLTKSVDYVLTHAIKPRIIAAAGLSMGATSSIAAVCKLPDIFDAAISIAGSSNYPCGKVNRSLMVVGGKKDYSQDPLTAKIIADRWIDKSVECQNDYNSVDNGSIHIRTWSQCSSGQVVREVLLDDTGHEWPLNEYNTNVDISLFLNVYLTMVPIIEEYLIGQRTSV